MPIVHVNADDPEACLAAIRLAVAYRERFHDDFLIDVVGYRRHGHNEGDEPAYTQPRMYEQIAIQPTVRELYLRRLASEGIVDEAAAGEEFEAAGHELAGIQDALHGVPSARGRTGRRAAGATGRPGTASRGDAVDMLGRSNGAAGSAARIGVPLDELREINAAVVARPAGFTVHPKLLRQLDRRHAALADGGRIAWAHAEALAFASLLVEGVPIRLTGQDTERGTFSQRHLVLHDAETGERFAPIAAPRGRGGRRSSCTTGRCPSTRAWGSSTATRSRRRTRW